VKIGRSYEKRDYGSGRLTWRPAPAAMRRGEPVARAVRVETNRQTKKQRLVFK